MLAQDWNNFGMVSGGASGALTGLLFVAVSLNRDRLAQYRWLRASAAGTLVLFIVPLLIAIILVTPGQPTWVIGVEFISLGVVGGVTLTFTGRGRRAFGDDDDTGLAKIFDRTSSNIATMVALEIAGSTLLAGHGGGFYWLVPAVAVALIGGVINAWLFLVGPPARGGKTTTQTSAMSPTSRTDS